MSEGKQSNIEIIPGVLGDKLTVKQMNRKMNRTQLIDFLAGWYCTLNPIASYKAELKSTAYPMPRLTHPSLRFFIVLHVRPVELLLYELRWPSG